MNKQELFKKIEHVTNDSLDLGLILLLSDYVKEMNWEELSYLDRYLIFRDSQISCEHKIKSAKVLGNRERVEELLDFKRTIDISLQVIREQLYIKGEVQYNSRR